ncbi:SAM-dependent methyltransferase [Nonomuraea roseoviolacea subsp. roseoviolacea]|uniref:S-adenosyl-L-methionine-dependent methyltransferase n=1 Tax=Nonomuraea roseoviolacea subsp. carminata TaxID=160689 RepID=A0ABT1K7D8_9ACTN|nr:SAM-dependent methyltransferase [Nonomuraea roseoviolacea]MCP2349903.1 methyltransferase (TIGR00027 family) [Nonomuraea roseoviolacea subsp. carminata]
MHAVAATARWTAAARAKESRREDAIFTDPYAEQLAGQEGTTLFARYDNPGVGEFIAIRTRYLDDLIGHGGFGQVVLLAAGMDTRSVRLPWPPGTVLYEVDQADLLAEKDKRLADLGARHACDRRAVGADLTGDWPRALREAGWDPSAPTLWLAEGLLFYLPEPAARLLLQRVAAAGAPGSVLAGDLLSHQSMVSEFSKEGLRRLTEDGCPWLFGTDEPEEFLSGCGWRVTELRMPGEEGASYGRWPWNPPLPREARGFPQNFLFVAAND